MDAGLSATIVGLVQVKALISKIGFDNLRNCSSFFLQSAEGLKKGTLFLF